jgi:hypothetical protein
VYGERVPDSEAAAGKGMAIVNLLQLDGGEKVKTVIRSGHLMSADT